MIPEHFSDIFSCKEKNNNALHTYIIGFYLEVQEEEVIIHH